MSDLNFVQGDTGPSISGALTNADGTVFSLTAAANVRFQMRLLTSRVWAVDALATVVSAAAGTVRYDWAAGNLDVPGDYECRWQITFTDTTIEHTVPANTITVEAQ